jgi:hypothetical protein
MVQIFGWFSAEAVRASGKKRPSAFWSRDSCGGRNFSATLRPRLRSSASQTTPIPPLPSWPVMR